MDVDYDGSSPSFDKNLTPQSMRGNAVTGMGKSLGLSVRATYATLFAINERVPQKKRLTDIEIANLLDAEFPARTSELSKPEHMDVHRKFYNERVRRADQPLSRSYP